MIIQPNPPIIPQPILKGYVPSDWKVAIYIEGKGTPLNMMDAILPVPFNR
jgi:hypothetical protein